MAGAVGLNKHDPPRELKISLIAAIPHKSKAFCSILDLLFWLRLKNRGVLAMVNDTTKKTDPAGAINQIGDCLSQVIQVFAEVDKDAKIFIAKWDIKRMNFCKWTVPKEKNGTLLTSCCNRKTNLYK